MSRGEPTPLTVDEARAILAADQVVSLVNSAGRFEFTGLDPQERVAWDCLVKSAQDRIAMWEGRALRASEGAGT